METEAFVATEKILVGNQPVGTRGKIKPWVGKNLLNYTTAIRHEDGAILFLQIRKMSASALVNDHNCLSCLHLGSLSPIAHKAKETAHQTVRLCNKMAVVAGRYQNFGGFIMDENTDLEASLLNFFIEFLNTTGDLVTRRDVVLERIPLPDPKHE